MIDVIKKAIKKQTGLEHDYLVKMNKAMDKGNNALYNHYKELWSATGTKISGMLEVLSIVEKELEK